MKIGFIGLGNMGAPMAANLAAAGHTVTGFDLVTEPPAGVGKANTVVEAATGQDAVITMLPNGQILQSVAGDIVTVMDKGAAFIDCSTVDVESAREVGERPRQRLGCMRLMRLFRVVSAVRRRER